jgi:membrane peptidoglycan carboxypeptidase
VVSTEDPRFWQHGGVDVISLVRASLTNVASGGNGPGGSTVTMQYVKNSLIEQATIAGDQAAIAAAQSRGLDRKLREMRLAIALEQKYSKKDIFAGYANLSFFGGTINGIEAASEYYYNKHASDLTVAQGAMLGAMLKAPNDYRPDLADNAARAKGRRDYVINNMLNAGYITNAQAAEAIATPVATTVHQVPGGCETNQTEAFFCDYVVWTIRNNPEFGPTVADRENLLRRGGLDIYTTMNINIQKAAYAAEQKWVPPTDPSQIGSASVSVQVGTGRILAMAENRVFDQSPSPALGHTSVNYAADKAYGGSSGFQSGSTYKIFTLAAWLQAGKKLMDHVDGRVKEWNATDFHARCGTLVGTWAPKNITKEPEDLSVVQATSMSVNTAFANMASQLDLCDIRDVAQAFGVHRADGNELLYVPSSILGVNELSPLTMAAAQAGVSNHGIFCTPIAIDRILVRSSNQEMTIPQTQCKAAVAPEIAAGMTYAMKRVISGGTGGASATGDGTMLAGKTGTTDSGVHTWMTGFSSAVATATWVGNVSGTQALSKILLNHKAGNTVRHDIWRTIMKVADKEYPTVALDEPPQSMIDATMATVPNVYGQIGTDAAQHIQDSDLNAALVVVPVPSIQPKGTVAYTRPGPSKSIPRGTQVRIFISGGGMVRIPSVGVVGETVATATATLKALGFPAVSLPQPSQPQYMQHSATVPNGNVIGTVPAVGSNADPRGAILLIISTGP